MRKLAKRLLSCMTVFLLGLTMLSASSPTTDVEAATSARNLYVEFMGRGSTPENSSPGLARLTSADVTNQFWVGVAVDNVSDLPMFTQGVFSLEIAFEYDPLYVEPYYINGSTAASDWQTALEDGNLGDPSDATWDEKAWWKDAQYEIISMNETDINTDSEREGLADASTRIANGWEMCTVLLSFDGSAWADARYITNDDKQYLIKLPFILNDAPDPTDPDPNPTVLSLVRGPETFDIGSGADGTEHHAEWVADNTANTTTTENLKNLFNFKGDISLFDAAGAVDDIIAYKTKTGTETSDTPYELSTTKSLGLDGFKDGATVYYLSVPNEVEKLKLNITSSVAPDVSANGSPVLSTFLGNKLYVTDEFGLAELDRTVDPDGFDNTVIVTVNGTPYTIHIRRLLKPQMTLNYGNSPYGEIMKEPGWDPATKTLAKQKFDVYNYYDPSYIPTNAAEKADIVYGPQAWVKIENLGSLSPAEEAAIKDPYVNMDRNDYAIFVYNGQYFRDPGFVATDSLGQPITTVTRKITVDRMQKTQLSGLQDANVTSDPITIPDKAPDHLITEVTMPYDYTDSDTYRIRPGIYEMEYSYEDDMLGPITFADDADNIRVRKVVVLQGRGDSFLEDVINDSAVNPIYTYLKTPSSYDSITEEARWIYFYRVLDADANGAVNDSDPNPIYTYLKVYKPAIDAGSTTAKNPLHSHYVLLPSV